MFVLPVKIDEPSGGFAQRCRRHERAVDERAAASLRGDFSPDDELSPVSFLENCLDRCGLLAGPHEIRARSTANEQTDGSDDDRLACARFSREDVQAWREFQLETIDHGEIADAEIPKHDVGYRIGTAAIPNSPRSPASRDTATRFRCSYVEVP